MFKTWDQFLLPYPFSKGVFIWGDPIYVNEMGMKLMLRKGGFF